MFKQPFSNDLELIYLESFKSLNSVQLSFCEFFIKYHFNKLYFTYTCIVSLN